MRQNTRTGSRRDGGSQRREGSSNLGVYVSARKRQDQRNRKRPNPLEDSRFVDYTDAKLLQKFINDQGRILPRRLTGVTAKQQRQVALAVKYARHLALLPFVAQDIQ